MIERIYTGTIESISKSVGIHPYLRNVYVGDNKSLINKKLIKIGDRGWLQSNANLVFKFGEPEVIKIGPAKSFPRDIATPTKLAQLQGQYELQRPFVAELRHGKILSESGIAVSNDGTVLLDAANSRESKVLRHFTRNKKSFVSVLKDQRAVTQCSEPDLDCAVSFIRAPYGNCTSYHHWVHEHLTKLEGIQHYINKTGNKPTPIIESDAPSWISDTLTYFGYSDNDIVQWERGKELCIDRLVVPSVRRVEESYPRNQQAKIYKLGSPAAHTWLRQEAVSRIRTEKNTKLYSEKILIVRTDVENRQIANRNEVINELAPYGFKPYELGSMSFEEQIRLFNNASTVVGIHGAGLVNTIFSEQTNIVEICAKIKPTFYLLAEANDRTYRCIIPDDSGPNYEVNIKDLKEAVNSL